MCERARPDPGRKGICQWARSFHFNQFPPECVGIRELSQVPVYKSLGVRRDNEIFRNPRIVCAQFWLRALKEQPEFLPWFIP